MAIPKKIRESIGGGFRDVRGRLFVRVTVAPQDRQARLAPWATSLEQVEVRGKIVQAWVNRLREAGQTEFIETILELGAAAPDEETLEKVGIRVTAIVGNDFDRVKVKPSQSPLATQTETWLASVVAMYDAKTHTTLTQYASKWPELFPDGIITSKALARWLAVRLGQVTASTVKKELWGLRAF